jgi:hypothetical protein
MAILKEPEDNKGWFECSRCRHSFYIDLGSVEYARKEEKEMPSKESCLSYDPLMEYSVGDCIYHAEWDDLGKVEAKKKLSNGSTSIVVKFQKSGTKYLIEKMKIIEEPIEEESQIEIVDKPAEETIIEVTSDGSEEIAKQTNIEEPVEIERENFEIKTEENETNQNI